MLGRTLRLAAVTLFIGFFAVSAAQAQNLEAGKSPSQIFAGTCNGCHRTPRGLLKTVSAGSLPGFLRQHYTTSGEMAAQLSSFLIANGASDGRSRQGADAKPAAATTDQVDWQGRRLRAGTPQEPARPEADGGLLQGRKRLARPEPTDTAKPAADGQMPPQAGSDRGPDGRKLSTSQRLSRRAKPGSEEVPSAKEEPQRLEPAIDDKAKPEAATEEVGKGETPKSSDEGKPEAARMETPRESGGETPVLRADPVPLITPASPAASPASAPGGSADPAPVGSSAASSVVQPAAPVPSEPPTAAVTASAPPPAPAGPPAPPISQ